MEVLSLSRFEIMGLDRNDLSSRLHMGFQVLNIMLILLVVKVHSVMNLKVPEYFSATNHVIRRHLQNRVDHLVLQIQDSDIIDGKMSHELEASQVLEKYMIYYGIKLSTQK